MTGTTVLHYRIGERLGKGGMGEVYRAEDTRLGRAVALKFVQASGRADPESRGRILREARAASSLRSPHIATIYDIGELNDDVFIVMEYVEGELLSRRLEGGPLPIPEALDIAMQTADALDEAHSQGVVHRDIKSGNLMIGARGRVKVLDFGLAKFVESERPPEAANLATTLRTQPTAVGTVLGTISYMAPEQARGRHVDHRADLFSLGVVIYEMVTSRLPFEGVSVTEIFDKILNHEPAALARFNYDVPSELETIVRKTLEKDPGFRYQSARELFIDLHNISRVLDNRRSLRSSGEDWDPVAFATGMAAGHAQSKHAALEKAVAVMSFSNITKEAADDWIGTGIAETVTADLKKIQGLTVIGRAQIFEAIKNLSSSESEFDERRAIDIGRRVRASWIIGGGYQRVGDFIRITAQFVDVSTGGLVKTVKVDGRIDDIFKLQDEIVYELTQGLNLKLARTEIVEIEQNETRSMEAYEAYSLGMMNLRMASRDSLDRAIYLFERATELDADYASAWAALGQAYEIKGEFLSLQPLVHKAITHLERALKLNPRLANAHRSIGDAYLNIGQPDRAIESISEAIRLDPKNAGGHSMLGRTYWFGKGMLEEGIRALEQAVALNPEAGYSHLQLGFLYTLRGDYEKAEAACRHAIDLQEHYLSGQEGMLIVGAHTRLGYVYYRQGRYDEAIREYERELTFLVSSDHVLRERSLIEVNQKLGAAYLKKGTLDDADRYFNRALRGFEERRAKGANDPATTYYVAAVYALRGDVEQSFKYVSESIRQLPALMTERLRLDPDFDAVRNNERFEAFFSDIRSAAI